MITLCPKGLTVDHLDNDPLNNRRSNLEIVTYGENNRRMWERKRQREL
jgi:uncharacterized protein YegL